MTKTTPRAEYTLEFKLEAVRLVEAGQSIAVAAARTLGVVAAYGITASMSRRDNCWDNACSETLFGSLKVERLHGQRFKTRRLAMDEVVAWMLWYSQTRLHSTLGYVSPVQFEEHWLANQSRLACA